MSDRSRYGLRVAESMVPCVEVTEGERVVKRCYGVTLAHAYNRALRWTRAHGDPRY